jgi:hypothetical protein
MPRLRHNDLLVTWKLHVPATLAGQVEFLLHDGIFNKPRYGSRAKLIEALLHHWTTRERNIRFGRPPDTDLPSIPTALEIQQR